VVVEQTQILQDRLGGRIEEASFDRGFHSPENQTKLAEIIDCTRQARRARKRLMWVAWLVVVGALRRGRDVSCVSMRGGRVLFQPQVAGTRHAPSFRGARGFRGAGGPLAEFPQAAQRTPHACCLSAMATHTNRPPQRKRRPRVLVHSSLSFCSNTARSACTCTETWNSVAHGRVHPQ
jgi:hypothetical protein